MRGGVPGCKFNMLTTWCFDWLTGHLVRLHALHSNYTSQIAQLGRMDWHCCRNLSFDSTDHSWYCPPFTASAQTSLLSSV